jgi:hypothetical protein
MTVTARRIRRDEKTYGYRFRRGALSTGCGTFSGSHGFSRSPAPARNPSACRARRPTLMPWRAERANIATAAAEPPLPTITSPMEAHISDELPEGPDWQFEPKWDGFRCLAFRHGEEVDLRAKSGKPLGRYFPEIVETLRSIESDGFVLDGELVVPVGDTLSFAALQMRLHPAESRIRRLAAESPALFILFDCLAASGHPHRLAGRLDRRGTDRTAVQSGEIPHRSLSWQARAGIHLWRGVLDRADIGVDLLLSADRVFRGGVHAGLRSPVRLASGCCAAALG